MNTQEIMQMALKLSGMDAIPQDSAIFSQKKNVERILFGIDIDEADLRRAKEGGYDLVIAHHPINKTHFISMIDKQEQLMISAGVLPNKAKEACRNNKAIYENWAQNLPADPVPDTLVKLALEMQIGFMNIHQPCDEIGRRILQNLADTAGVSGTVTNLIDIYQNVAEIQKSSEKVRLVCGSPNVKTGKIVVVHGAGTNGGYPVATALFESGVNTVVYIHLDSKKQSARIKEENKGNLVITGHYASDSIGINPLLDALEENGARVDCCNKMIRIKKSNK